LPLVFDADIAHPIRDVLSAISGQVLMRGSSLVMDTAPISGL